jgi:hypothetical protein
VVCAADSSGWAGAGGTSFSAPVLAGVQALVNQKTASAQGNPNYVYYRLGAENGAVCDSASGEPAAGACIFHNVTQGDISVNCGGAQNCFGATAGPEGAGPCRTARCRRRPMPFDRPSSRPLDGISLRDSGASTWRTW